MARMLKTEVDDHLNYNVEQIQEELGHSNKMDTVAYLVKIGTWSHKELDEDTDE